MSTTKITKVIDSELAEKKQILKKYRNLIYALKSKMGHNDREMLRKALKLAVEAHKDMRRKSGEPYIYHPIEVAQICIQEIGLGTTSAICALLHDVVEDTDYTLTDIEGLFGPKIAKIIDGLTKISGIFDQTSPSLQAENFRKMLLTLSDDVRVILIKLADRLHNMRTLEAMPLEKRLKIASETVYLYAPLAHRLGLFAIKSELEDLALKFTEPEIFRTISQKIVESEEERQRFIHNFLNPIKKALKETSIEYKVISRTKSINSIWNKMKKKEIPFEEVYDLFAIRIVINSPPATEKTDCWHVYSIVTDHYIPKHDRLRDWISIPKANGYESLHTTVMSKAGRWVEIQIRSTRMDEIAEKGYAAHWKYKSNDSESGLDEWLYRIRELLQNPGSSALDFLDDFKMNLFSDEIFVFTPNGDMKSMPVNSTIIDFAYNIHSEIGNTAIGAKVNHKLVPLNYVIKSGDQIEVITSRKQAPKEEWLDMAVTARAKSQIKNAIKDLKRQYIDEGRDNLKHLFQLLGIELNNNNIRRFQNYTNTPGHTDFYYKIANGEIGIKDLRQFHSANERSNWLSYFKRPFSRSPKQKPGDLSDQIREQLKKKPESFALGTDYDKIDFQIAKCCNPIPGDDVIGFNNLKGSIILHRTNCKIAIEQASTFGNQIVKAKYTNKEAPSFLTGIKITGIDRMSLLSEITNVISNQLNVNIRSFNVTSSEGYFEGSIMIYVMNTEHLKELTDKIETIAGIVKVVRISS